MFTTIFSFFVIVLAWTDLGSGLPMPKHMLVLAQQVLRSLGWGGVSKTWPGKLSKQHFIWRFHLTHCKLLMTFLCLLSFWPNQWVYLDYVLANHFAAPSHFE